MACPLCLSGAVNIFLEANHLIYFECSACSLVFLHPSQRLNPQDEKARYETHQNNPDDPGYRDFLNRLMAPVLPRLKPHAQGLDYGSGPGPTLSIMLAENGHVMDLYDPFFTSTPGALEKQYDFVTCTETAEHFFNPRAEFGRMKRLLRPDGLLAVMTAELERKGFASWYYRNDPTHVTFYSETTFNWIARHYEFTLEHPRKDVFILRGRC